MTTDGPASTLEHMGVWPNLTARKQRLSVRRKAPSADPKMLATTQFRAIQQAATRCTGPWERDWRARSARPSAPASRDTTAISNRRLTSKLAIGLFAAIAIDTLLQLAWKTTVLETAADAAPLATLSSVFSNPASFGVLFLMAIQFFNWLIVLSQADLSYVKPISSLSYATVPIFSALVLGEAVDGLEIMGLACVITGVWLISQTQPMTPKSSKPQETPSILPVVDSWGRRGSHFQGHAK